MLRSIVSVIQQPGFRLELLNHKLCPSLASLDRLRNGATRAASSAQEAAAGSKPSETASTGENGSTSDGDAAAAHDESFADVDVSQLKEALRTSEAKVTELQAEMEQVQARSVQVLSDIDNLRKRTSKQVAEVHQFALQGFCKNILDVADNLERALDSVPDTVLETSQQGAPSLAHAEATEGSVTCETVAKNLCSLHNGVGMSNKIMMKIFKDNGLEKVETELGGPFDPNVHNAMFEVPTADMEVGRIAAVMKQGYALNGRIIRAADVGVAKSLDG